MFSYVVCRSIGNNSYIKYKVSICYYMYPKMKCILSLNIVLSSTLYYNVALHTAMGYNQKTFASVVVLPAPVRIPNQRPLFSCVTSAS